MIFRVFLFARARDLAGADMVEVDLSEGATAGGLRQALAATHPNLASLVQRSAIAVNDEFAKETQVLPAGAEIALLPPVSGGC